mmetsp:Transcript_8493/g.27951  ORF Transcript_8493/g.27951 Transcript_8493/m.27951 type:complete len:232 (+) Transcript_8493:479-1174(+)
MEPPDSRGSSRASLTFAAIHRRWVDTSWTGSQKSCMTGTCAVGLSSAGTPSVGAIGHGLNRAEDALSGVPFWASEASRAATAAVTRSAAARWEERLASRSETRLTSATTRRRSTAMPARSWASAEARWLGEPRAKWSSNPTGLPTPGRGGSRPAPPRHRLAREELLLLRVSAATPSPPSPRGAAHTGTVIAGRSEAVGGSADSLPRLRGYEADGFSPPLPIRKKSSASIVG